MRRENLGKSVVLRLRFHGINVNAMLHSKLQSSIKLQAVRPIEVKSGKDYQVHSALDNFVRTPDYQVKEAIVLSNRREVTIKDGITYLPIYYVMFI